MKPLSNKRVSTIKNGVDNVKTSQDNVKTPMNCRLCGEFCFIKKKMPYWRGTPPLKVGVVCLKCGETTVISYQEFCEYHLLKGK
jgi:hypothetical protein